MGAVVLGLYNRLTLRTADYFFRKVLKRPMGKNGKKFVERVSYIFLATFLASMLTFVLNFLMVRFLGPAEYGKFILITVVAGIIGIPMLFGLDTASTHYLAKEGDKKKIISTTFVSVFTLSILVAILVFVFADPIASLFNTTNFIVLLAILFALGKVIHSVFKGIFQGLQFMKKIAILKVIQHIMIAVLLAILLFIVKDHTLTNPFIANFVGFAVTGLVMLIYLRKYLVSFSKRYFKRLTKYGFVFFFVNTGFILVANIHLIFVNAFLGVSLLGLYAAYWAASHMITTKLYDIFITVFFPTVSGKINKKAVLKTINRLSFLAFVLVALINLFIISLALFLYGEKYTFYFGMVVAFSINAGLDILYKVHMWLLSSEGLRGAKKVVKVFGVMVVVNILLNVILIPIFNLYGGILSLIITNTLFILYFRHLNQELIFNKTDPKQEVL